MLHQLLGIPATAIFGKHSQCMENDHLFVFRICQPSNCVVSLVAVMIHDIRSNDLAIFYADKLILLCNRIFDHFVRGKASLIAFRQKVLFSQNLTHTVIKLP